MSLQEIRLDRTETGAPVQCPRTVNEEAKRLIALVMAYYVE